MLSEKNKEIIESKSSEQHPVVFRLCGHLLPVAGLSGVVAARALREGLMMARDTDSEIMYDPKKQLLTDKLIRKLSDIPDTGFDNELDLPDIVNLAREIGVVEDVSEVSTFLETAVSLDIPDDEDCLDVEEGGQEEASQEEESGLLTPVFHKTMQILPDDDSDGAVAIDISKRSNEVQPKSLLEKTKGVFKLRKISDSGRDVNKEKDLTSVTKVKDVSPLKSINHRPLPTSRSNEGMLSADSLVNLYLTDEVYRGFINEQYASPQVLEKVLNNRIIKIEATTIDSLESWLGEDHVSPFVLLQKLSVKEVFSLAAQSDIKISLVENNIKYETFLVWIDLVDEMQSIVESDENIIFGELFSKWVIELEIGGFNNSQF